MNKRYHFEEGSIELPGGFHDRSTNIFVYGNTTPSPLNLNIARDVLLDGETLSAYVDRQVTMLTKNLHGYAMNQRAPAVLGAGSAATAGEQITSTYKSRTQTIHQRQAAFPQGDNVALIFSCSSIRRFDAEQNALWNQWLASFRAPESD
ncbi:DUF1795 domain-containing protein [Caballeronia sp. LZ008]|uniref:DcrB-related protein n=1 Tax=unclassified Caballeronia TaxID=2646786 RepID=UPI00202780E5|nr:MULTISPECIES: DUF1795 domain-containing protein [unclassified Caballeronia]MDR5796400.1 DUF1795 domain-containing protein [Caballeronia sp. LZ008]